MEGLIQQHDQLALLLSYFSLEPTTPSSCACPKLRNCGPARLSACLRTIMLKEGTMAVLRVGEADT
jgi:hypothetical protein